uniref:Uncharacterized protein n=1 Tax=Arundo donax TaxID=35708 RepID=A0A0A9DTN6_ARUDO
MMCVNLSRVLEKIKFQKTTLKSIKLS